MGNTCAISEPCYYHQEYANDTDVSSKTNACLDPANFDCLNRILRIALPLSTLYQPFYFPASVGLGAIRSVSNMFQLISSIKNGNNIGSQALHTSFAVAALAGTILMHPLGMLLTTAQDLLIDISKLAFAMKEGDYKKAFETSASIINNGMYMALFFDGGTKLAIASLSTQVLMEAYRIHTELKKGNYMAAVEHMTLAAIRGVQLNQQLKMFATKNKVESFKPQNTIQQHDAVAMKSSKKQVAKSWFWKDKKDPYTGAGKPSKGAKTGLLGLAVLILGVLVTPVNPIAGGAIIGVGATAFTDGIISHNF